LLQFRATEPAVPVSPKPKAPMKITTMISSQSAIAAAARLPTPAIS